MNPLILFFIPPVVGAFIGYSTNVVAIKMLFRPLKEIRVFGLKLPFTPGILPRQRSKLAQSIGAMVERELLTPEIIRARLNREDVRTNIKAALSLFTDSILEKTPAQLLEGNENTLSKLYPCLVSSVVKFLGREDVKKELESKGRVFLRSVFLKLNAFQRFFVSAGQYDTTLEQKMPEIINELIASANDMLLDEKTKKMFFENILGGQDKKISELLNISCEDKEKLDNYLFEKLMDAADGQIENILSSVNIKELVSDRIDSLDMLRVERIILDVMSDQFKWIEIFGGILGFLIGAFQSTLSYILR